MKSCWEIVIRKSAAGRCRRFLIKKSQVWAIGVFFFIFSGAVIYMGMQFHCLKKASGKQTELEKELAIRESQIDYFAQRLSQISDKLINIGRLRDEVEQRLGRGKVFEEGGLGGSDMPGLGRDVRKVAYLNSENELLKQMWSEMETLDKEAQSEESRDIVLNRFLKSHSALIRAIPSIRPVNGGFISSGFGRRKDPFTGSLKMHTGIDIAHANNVPVYATAEGVVTQAVMNSSYGNLITIYHGFGISTRYAHLKNMNIRTGQWVEQGQQIGVLGNTGRSTHRHLHYEVRLEGRPVNPYYFLPGEWKG